MSELTRAANGYRPTRRAALRAMAGAAAAAFSGTSLAGCAGALGGGVRFWNGFTGPDGRMMLRLVDAFNETSDHAAVMQRTDWGTYYSKLFVAGLGGRAPEVFILQAEQMARFVRAGLVRPMDDLFGDGGNGTLPTNDFDERVLDAVTFNGTRYGVPLDVHPMGTYYNTAILERAGYEAPPIEGEAFIDCLERVDALGGNIFPFIFTWFRLNAFTALWQWGGSVFNDDFTRCTLTSSRAVEAFEWCAAMSGKRGLAPLPQNAGDAWVGFRQGRVAVAWHGMFMLADLQRVDDLPWGAAPVAQVGPQPATWGGSHIICLRPDLEGERLETAFALVRFLSEQGLEWAKGGQIPPRASLRNTSEFAQMPAQVAFAKMLPYVQFMPQVPFVQEYLTEVDFAIEQTLRGSMSPQAALEQAAASIQRTIARYIAAGWDPTAPIGQEAA